MTFCSKRLAPLVLLGLLSLLGCQDDVGQGHGEATVNHANSTVGSNSAVEQGDGSPNASSNRQAGENNTDSSSGFTPEQEASREEDGAWSDVSQVTVIPQPLEDDVDEDSATFCRISYHASIVAIVRIDQKLESVPRCSEEPFNSYSKPYNRLLVERQLHIAGPRLPLNFELTAFTGLSTAPSMKEGKSYLVGLFEHEGKVFNHANYLEVIPYDAARENRRVKFSGKVEALAATGEAHMDNRNDHCENSFPVTHDFYERTYLTRNQDVCERFAR